MSLSNMSNRIDILSCLVLCLKELHSLLSLIVRKQFPRFQNSPKKERSVLLDSEMITVITLAHSMGNIILEMGNNLFLDRKTFPRQENYYPRNGQQLFLDRENFPRERIFTFKNDNLILILGIHF